MKNGGAKQVLVLCVINDKRVERISEEEGLMKKILVFDDEKAIRMLYELELSEDGYEIIFSGDASRWLELIREHRPRVIVMYKKMGSRDGLDILRQIRRYFPVLPLVLCTAHPSQSADENPRVVDFHATETSDLQDLKEKIRAALSLPRC
jgi:CheY-like chemotaxis protein